MAVPTTPHLNWGGTTCPGARWREWVPQLREEALQEDDMDLTAEQHAMLQTIHHMTKIVLPAEHSWLARSLRALEASNNARYEAIRGEATKRHREMMEAIAAIGTVSGPTADAIAKKIANELAERLLE